MSARADLDLLVESVFDAVLEMLEGAEDDDTVRAEIALRAMREIVEGFKQPRPELLAKFDALIAKETTVGDLRERTRIGFARLAAGRGPELSPDNAKSRTHSQEERAPGSDKEGR